MSLLNIKQTEYLLRDMQNNLPISLNDIQMFEKFLHECKSVNNKIINNTLKEYFNNFENSLRAYWLKRSNYTFGFKNEPELFGFPENVKSNDYALYEKRVKELDELASKSYKNLEKLIEFTKKEGIYKETF